MDFGNISIDQINGINVLRDDKYPGGTKARILNIIINEIEAKEFVYAGHPFGHASTALAYACKKHKRRATIFFPKMNEYPPPFYETKKFENVEIKIVSDCLLQKDLLPFAQNYASRNKERHLFPIGFSTPDFEKLLTDFAKTLPVDPKEVWCIAGSGTLARCMQKAWPDAKINAVSLKFPQLNAGNALVYEAPEAEDQLAEYPPPFPSADFYDSKAWRFVEKYANEDALFWNVAG